MSERRILRGNDVCPLKFHRDGYVLRPGGIAYAKAVRFDAPWCMTVVLVRSCTGRLLRVERSGRSKQHPRP